MAKSKVKVIIVVGLPGSGKTTFINEVLRPEHPKFKVYDDVLRGTTNLMMMQADLQFAQNAIVSDVQFCNDRLLTLFIESLPNNSLIWTIYFSNDPEACQKNVLRRARPNKNFELAFITKHSPNYFPKNPIPCYRESSSGEMADAVA